MKRAGQNSAQAALVFVGLLKGNADMTRQTLERAAHVYVSRANGYNPRRIAAPAPKGIAGYAGVCIRSARHGLPGVAVPARRTAA
jgi:hypothetical protein